MMKEHNLLAQNETRKETHTHTRFNEQSTRKKQKKNIESNKNDALTRALCAK